MEPLLSYYCKDIPNDEEIESACRIAEMSKKPISLLFESYKDNLNLIMIHPGQEVADVQIKLKNKLFQESFC